MSKPSRATLAYILGDELAGDGRVGRVRGV
jgi:hypothetical protein